MYRITITRIENVPDTNAKWLNEATEDGRYGYVKPPEGQTTEKTTQVYEQIMETLNLPRVVCFLNSQEA